VHEEVVKLDQDFGATFSGVLTDDEGRIRALWGSYAEQVGRQANQLPENNIELYMRDVLACPYMCLRLG
jgi:hypothetical protein